VQSYGLKGFKSMIKSKLLTRISFLLQTKYLKGIKYLLLDKVLSYNGLHRNSFQIK